MKLATIPTATEPRMSSVEIAALCDKQHGHVLRDIATTLTEAGIGLSKFGASYRNAQNKEQPCYLLPRRECDLVISGYSVKYRLAIIDRWHELETKQAFQLPQTFAEALRLAADSAEQAAAAHAQLAIAAPKAEALDRIGEADGTLCMSTAAKNLQVRPIDLNKHLVANRWIFQRAGCSEWTAYQDKIQQGLLAHKIHIQPLDDGERIRTQVRVTAKGMTRLAGEFSFALK